jgi:hypothetical protein
MDYSKYKITSELVWLDNLGRWVAMFKSDVYPLKAEYILPDTVVYTYSESTELVADAKAVLNLNFWFACFQYEQQLKNNNVPQASGQVPAVEGPVNA